MDRLPAARNGLLILSSILQMVENFRAALGVPVRIGLVSRNQINTFAYAGYTIFQRSFGLPMWNFLPNM
jgi:hypothetical protein